MTPSLVFTVRRHDPELIAPSKPTPHEMKPLSDIDDQDGLRFQIPVIQFYRYDESMAGKDPVDVIRKALAKTLVFYYPFAGRLREVSGRKLMVDCNEEGVLFIEADADVSIEQFGDSLQPPFPCWEELLYDVPGSGDVLNTPLLPIQVTRLKCGGFIFALRLNHTMSDAAGLVQFMNALGEISRGMVQPTTPPVWCRELLNSRDPPRATCTHREYEQVPDTHGTIIPLDDMAHRSFFFGPTEVSTIRSLLPYHQQQSSNFEILTACLWRCRTAALQPENNEEVRIICIVNARAKFDPPLPTGYYGNAFAFPVAVTTAGTTRKVCSDNSRAEPGAQNKVHAPETKDKESKLKVTKARKVKPETKKNHADDWDKLRKEVLENGTKKERSKDTMDSLDYEAIRCAPVEEISKAIRERGMNNMLAERMKEFLNRLVEDHGSIDLEWLREVPPDQTKDYLLSIRGLGLKSVECVRLLTLHHLAFPVDTNVGRIAVRLGWVPLQPLPEELQIHLLEMYPVLESVQKYLWPRLCKLDQRTLYELHYQMITFGKVFCTKKQPNCNACPMRAECRHFASAFASARLALPGPEEKRIVSMAVPIEAERNPSLNMNPMILPLPDSNLEKEVSHESGQYCEPIIEEPATPEQCTETVESDIEDFFYWEDPDELPKLDIDHQLLAENVQNCMQESGGDLSKAIVAWTSQSASIPAKAKADGDDSTVPRPDGSAT